jgi:hypothetical protein
MQLTTYGDENLCRKSYGIYKNATGVSLIPFPNELILPYPNQQFLMTLFPSYL